MWCKLFEKEYSEEIKNLLEYKIELTETITYYSAKEQFGVTKAIREFHSTMRFMVFSENVGKFAKIKERIAKFTDL